ncbi:hypothetical protein [Accumulibacter sp.]|uniref:hypothetical protein n=1 Tax=Accumulibacter sp. TaxID=2053492 RepID=UPI00258C520B|nr:hypothetical protein [Accumulibacter sp.]
MTTISGFGAGAGAAAGAGAGAAALGSSFFPQPIIATEAARTISTPGMRASFIGSSPVLSSYGASERAIVQAHQELVNQHMAAGNVVARVIDAAETKNRQLAGFSAASAITSG